MLAVIIILFVIGAAVLVAGFFIKEDSVEEYEARSEEYLEQMLEERMNQVEHRLGQRAKMSASTIKEQTEQELEKLSREKLSAVDEYSDQVMDRINKNHNEVMFLYGLLSDKQKELDQTVEALNNAQRQLQISNRINMKENIDEEKSLKARNALKEKDVSVENGVSVEKGFLNEKQPKKAVNQPKEGHKSDKRTEILQLAEEGKSDIEIAKQLSMGVGEVRLFLELGKGV